MAYQFEQSELLPANTCRIVGESIDESVQLIDGQITDHVEIVHEIRKHCKKVRSLFRLVDLHPKDHLKSAIIWYRDIARSLSRIREAQIWVPVFDELLSNHQGGISTAEQAMIRDHLEACCSNVEEDAGGMLEVLDRSRVSLLGGMELINPGHLAHCSVELAYEGLKEGHRRALRAAHKAQEDPTENRFHDWRKQAKTHWYHIRLIEPIWPEHLAPYGEEVYKLTDVLGRERDLFTLLEGLNDATVGAPFARSLSVVRNLIGSARTDLRHAATEAGHVLSAWDPDAVQERLVRFWKQ